jgi:hypothetical protein
VHNVPSPQATGNCLCFPTELSVNLTAVVSMAAPSFAHYTSEPKLKLQQIPHLPRVSTPLKFRGEIGYFQTMCPEPRCRESLPGARAWVCNRSATRKWIHWRPENYKSKGKIQKIFKDELSNISKLPSYFGNIINPYLKIT